ncbi:MAG TPA: helix-turn-helix domain-containing protein [bacterium]|nr:helix-turn-helix domain-containing protein [bacterium]
MNTGSEPGRHSLERVGQALDKVRRVLRDLEQAGRPAEASQENVAAGGAAPNADHRHDQLRAHEAAQFLNIPLKEVYVAVRDRRLIATRFGRNLWFNRTDLEAFARATQRLEAFGRATQRAGRQASATASPSRPRAKRVNNIKRS